MPGRLHLDSFHGDTKLATVEFAIHGTTNLEDANSVLLSGMAYRLGRPIFSTDLIHAYDCTMSADKQKPGRVMIVQRPHGMQFGYGVFTSAYVDRALKRVGGAPMRYAAGRKQLALYEAGDADGRRQMLEREVPLQGIFGLPEGRVVPQYVMGWLVSDQMVSGALVELRTAALDYAFVPIEQFTAYIAGQVQESRLQPAELSGVVRGLVVGTIESVIISRLRLLRWRGLAGLGYSFYEGQEPVTTIQPLVLAEYRERLEDAQRRMASSRLFEGDLAWMKAYVSSHLEIMTVEVDPANLAE